MLDTSSEFHELSFAPGVTMEGQFLASLAPSSSRSVHVAALVEFDRHFVRRLALEEHSDFQFFWLQNRLRLSKTA